MTDVNKKIVEALELAFQYGTCDGSHHKMWVIDQMVRVLLGPEKYELWVAKFNGPADEDGCTEYEWDVGTPP